MLLVFRMMFGKLIIFNIYQIFYSFVLWVSLSIWFRDMLVVLIYAGKLLMCFHLKKQFCIKVSQI